jgi:hypothetical protein
MTTKKWRHMTNEQRALALFEAGGADAIHTAVERGLLITDGYSWCLGCDADTPKFKNHCLVCGAHVHANIDKFPPCEYCGAIEQPYPEAKIPGDWYCPNCKGVR